MNKERGKEHIMYKMFTLESDRPLYLRIRKGMKKRTAEELYRCPVSIEFAGQIVKLTERPCNEYTAKVGDDFASLARAFGVGEEELRSLNDGVIYPTRKIFWLSKSVNNS